MTFEELGLRGEVLKSLEDLGFSVPTPIQEQAIPHLMKDDCDFVGLAQTGTGKTAAFGLPLISNIDTSLKLPQGLIICPTRELCLQISKDLGNYSKYLDCNIVAVAFKRAPSIDFDQLYARAMRVEQQLKLPAKSWVDGLMLWMQG